MAGMSLDEVRAAFRNAEDEEDGRAAAAAEKEVRAAGWLSMRAGPWRVQRGARRPALPQASTTHPP
jgi:hypothetical protein